MEIAEPTESTAVNNCCFQGSESSHGPSRVSHLTSHIPLHISRSLLSPPAVWAVLRAAIPNGNLIEQGLSVANPDLCDPPCSAGVIGTKPAQHRGIWLLWKPKSPWSAPKAELLELQPEVRTVLFTFHGNIPCLPACLGFSLCCEQGQSSDPQGAFLTCSFLASGSQNHRAAPPAAAHTGQGLFAFPFPSSS